MKKFFKILRKIIKILLKILLWILIFFISIIIIFNDRHFKYYDGYKFTFNDLKKINDWYEIYYNLKTSEFSFNSIKNWYSNLNFDFNINNINDNYIVIKLLFYKCIGIKNNNEIDILWNVKLYYDDGIMYSDWIFNWKFTNKSKKFTINHTGYYENWNLMAKWVYTWFYEDWKSTSNLNWYYENWNINLIENYILTNNNEKILSWEYFEYYENWNLKTEWIYESWEKIWIWTWYYENWNINLIENYDDWNLDWEYFEYYENWQIRENWIYINWLKKWIRNQYLEDWYIFNTINYMK